MRARRERSAKTTHDLGRLAVSGNLGADGSKGHGEDVVEGSDEGELRNVLVGVGVLLGESRDEREAGEEGELSDLWVVK